jgi:hypothetical protein
MSPRALFASLHCMAQLWEAGCLGIGIERVKTMRRTLVTGQSSDGRPPVTDSKVSMVARAQDFAVEGVNVQ